MAETNKNYKDWIDGKRSQHEENRKKPLNPDVTYEVPTPIDENDGAESVFDKFVKGFDPNTV